MAIGETRLLTLFVCIFSCLLIFSIYRGEKECNCVCDYKNFEPSTANIADSITDSNALTHSTTTQSDKLRGGGGSDSVVVAPPQIKTPEPAVAPLASSSSSSSSSSSTPPKNRQIFIDIGANDGSSVNYFLKKGDGVDYSVPWVQGGASDGQLSGRGAHGLWDMYVVEANPHFTPKLTALRKSVLESKRAASFTLLDSTAITTTNGPVTFHLDKHNKGKGNFGSTLMADSRSVMGVGNDVTVNGMDIVYFLRELVKVSPGDYVVLKMDIEGSEFDVLRHMIATHAIALVNELAVEYHHSNYGVFAGRDRPERVKEYRNKHSCLQWIMDDLNGTVNRIDWS